MTISRPRGLALESIAEVDSVPVPTCDPALLTSCENLATVSVGAGSWLLQAKFSLVGTPFGLADRCGLVQGALFDPEVIDQATAVGLNVSTGSTEVSLMDAVVTTGITVFGVRCTEDAAAFLSARDLKLTALEVTNVIAP